MRTNLRTYPEIDLEDLWPEDSYEFLKWKRDFEAELRKIAVDEAYSPHVRGFIMSEILGEV